MYITLLYVSAFMFFIADRKIKRSSLAGIIMALFASLPFSYQTLYRGYKILKFIREIIPGVPEYKGNIPSVVFSVFISLIFTGILMFVAGLWSRELFCITRDEYRSRKMAKKLFVSASVIPGVVACLLYGYRYWMRITANVSWGVVFTRLFDNLGTFFLFLRPFYRISDKKIQLTLLIANTVYVALLLVFCILCIVLINMKRVIYKEQPEASKGKGSALSVFAITVSLAGVLTFLTNAQRGYIIWSSSDRRSSSIVPSYYSFIFGYYNNVTGKFIYTVQYDFCMFLRGLLIAGIALLVISIIWMAIKKKLRHNLFSVIFSIALILASYWCINRMMIEIVRFHNIR